MRGKGPGTLPGMVVIGITPAYAGKRRRRRSISSVSRDHPRVCGEKGLLGDPAAPCRGSPPRMRGKGSSSGFQLRLLGITPAYAGKRQGLSALFVHIWDHPRVCGEKDLAGQQGSVRWGSPPRMRGKDLRHRHPAADGGITPAYAGKRLKRSHRIGHFSCILCLFHSVLHRASASGGSRAGPCAPPCLPAQNAVPV